MSTNLRIKIANILIGIYGLFVLINSLLYYLILIPGETNIIRGILRVFGVSLIAYYLFKRNKFAYWLALVYSCVWAILGIFGIILISSSIGLSLELFINLIPVALLLTSFGLLLPREVRAQFK